MEILETKDCVCTCMYVCVYAHAFYINDLCYTLYKLYINIHARLHDCNYIHMCIDTSVGV